VTQQRKDFQSTAAEQQKKINALIASLREQASQIQRATRPMGVEVGRPVSQMVAENE
jgi:hypothetical protein